jgi:hypothetical protein
MRGNLDLYVNSFDFLTASGSYVGITGTTACTHILAQCFGNQNSAL